MPLYSLADKTPLLEGHGHFIAPTAAVIGHVILKSHSSIWFNAVIRADNDLISIGQGSNIQDGAVLHADPGFPVIIGKDVTVGHQAMLHGCSIGDGALIGIQAVILNGAVIGEGALIGAKALVTENMKIPPGALVLGAPAKVVKILSAERSTALSLNAANYINNAERFNLALNNIDDAYI
jgi:carbonic anhydrase/acetyltransferase-like protein (isoleucine patch superfamily)